MSLPYKVAIVTGASSGIGAELAQRLAVRGTKVALLARRRERLEALVESIKAKGGEAIAISCDVGKRADVDSAVQQTVSVWGSVDLAIANAGVANVHSADEFDLDLIEQTYRINLFGTLYLAAAVLPVFKKLGRGHLVGISSLASYRGLPNLLGYAGSKCAMNRDLEAIRNQVYKYNIAVSTICPGFVKTAMTDGQDLAQPLSMDLSTAVDRIIGAIDRKTKFYAFPWPVALVMRFLYVLPSWLFDPVARLYPRLPRPRRHCQVVESNQEGL